MGEEAVVAGDVVSISSSCKHFEKHSRVFFICEFLSKPALKIQFEFKL
jgi:hypothetical protein